MDKDTMVAVTPELESLRGQVLDIIHDTLEAEYVGTYIAGMDEAAGKIAALLSARHRIQSEGRTGAGEAHRIAFEQAMANGQAASSLRARVSSLFSAIQHGDDEHRAWLKEAIEKHFAGVAVPPVRGSGTKEALRARVAVLEGVLAHVADTLRRQHTASPGHASNAEKVNAALDIVRHALKETP